jgi:hypothetical protein
MSLNELINVVRTVTFQCNIIVRRMLTWVLRIIETGQLPRELRREQKKILEINGQRKVSNIESNSFNLCQFVVKNLMYCGQLCVNLL